MIFTSGLVDFHDIFIFRKKLNKYRRDRNYFRCNSFCWHGISFTIIDLLYPKTFILTYEDWRTLYLFCAIRNNNQCNRFLRWWYTKHKQMVVLIWNMIYLIDAKVIILRPKIFIWMIIYTIMRYQMLKDYTNYYYEILKRINQFCWMNPSISSI